MEVHTKGDRYNVKMARMGMMRTIITCAMDDRPGHGYASPHRASSRTNILEFILLRLHACIRFDAPGMLPGVEATMVT